MCVLLSVLFFFFRKGIAAAGYRYFTRSAETFRDGGRRGGGLCKTASTARTGLACQSCPVLRTVSVSLVRPCLLRSLRCVLLVCCVLLSVPFIVEGDCC